MGNRSGATYWAYQVLHVGFVVAPVLAGLDKFTNILTSWSMYLAPAVASNLPVSANVFMRAVGVIEIAAGVIVAVRPKIGGLIVSAWLVAIIINLFLARGFYDIALRDLGLALGALSLSLLSRDCGCKAQA
ncbi:MAG: hypothetical protein NT088_02155 [Candidatus Omnitrophica bacterium]|nr:hypothetical protein [Candidatus Omnitrophota bacterium]